MDETTVVRKKFLSLASLPDVVLNWYGYYEDFKWLWGQEEKFLTIKQPIAYFQTVKNLKANWLSTNFIATNHFLYEWDIFIVNFKSSFLSGSASALSVAQLTLQRKNTVTVLWSMLNTALVMSGCCVLWSTVLTRFMFVGVLYWGSIRTLIYQVEQPSSTPNQV